jgi:hypothetical protein
MIVMPTERVLKALEGRQSMADDRDGNIQLSDRIVDTLAQKMTFDQAPFGNAESWSYIEGYPRFDVGKIWPNKLLESLSKPEAVEAAKTG